MLCMVLWVINGYICMVSGNGRGIQPSADDGCNWMKCIYKLRQCASHRYIRTTAPWSSEANLVL